MAQQNVPGVDPQIQSLCDAFRRDYRAVQTEIAKAWIAQAESGEPGAADEARAALVRLERYYLSHPVAGGWYDQFDRSDTSLVATIPASSFYHVLCAVVEAEQVLG